MLFCNPLVSIENKPQPSCRGRRGFTLIELLVVIAIIAVVTSVVMFNQKGLSNNLELSNTAQQIVFTIRKAQANGLAVKLSAFDVTNSKTFYGDGRGVSFNKNKPPQYRYTDDGIKNQAVSLITVLKTYSLPSGFSISKITSCVDSMNSNCTTMDNLHIDYHRPEAQAYFSVIRGNEINSIDATQVSITVESNLTKKTKIITVYQTGGITVE